MQLIKALGFAGALILSAVVGGTLIGSAFAQDEGTDGDAAADHPYCDTFMDTLASELGVTRDDLTAAGRTAAIAAVDAAVAAGDLDEERAAEIRERIESAEGDGCGWFGLHVGRAFGHGMARGFLGGDVFEAAADAFGIPSEELIGELRDAGSLQALAEERGASYDEVKASILAAVAEGMDQERADAVIERLTAWLDEGGEVGGFRGHHRFGPWGGADA